MPGAYNRMQAQKALSSGARTNGTVTGDSVDRGSDNVSVLFVVSTHTLTDGVHTITIHDSDDGTSFAAATSGVQGATIATTATNDDAVFEIGYNGPKRYCRLNVVTSGATTGGVLSAVAVKEGGRKPVTRSG